MLIYKQNLIFNNAVHKPQACDKHQQEYADNSLVVTGQSSQVRTEDSGDRLGLVSGHWSALSSHKSHLTSFFIILCIYLFYFF